MRCSKCGSENPTGKKFCSECGASLLTHCPQCNAVNAPTAKFCGECGVPLAEPIRTPEPATPPVKTPEVIGERRHLTVLFCDLVGSTAIAAQLDPEEWRETVANYHRAATDAIEHFSGYVAQYLGDGVMALFCWPEAHDNDAERAVHAGLAILGEIAKLNERPARPKLSARVGIDSGAVVVGAGIGHEASIFGDTPNVAARAQNAADAGTVIVTDATYRLVLGLFVVEDRGEHQLKGIERPVQLYRVVQPSGARGRLEAAAAARGLTPFVGREDELRTLMGRWERALDGEGQVALIIGEAGIGKSRLVQRFHEQIRGTPHTWIEASAGAVFQNTPFYPVTEMLRQALFAGGNGPLDAIAQLAGVLTHAGLNPVEAIPLTAPFLNLPLTAEYPPSTLSPEGQRRRLLATLVELVLGTAHAQTLVIATEDLHWADPSTLELIQLLVELGARTRLLLLYTARPEFRAPWPTRAHHTQINLSQLSASNVRTMVGEVAAQKTLSAETIATVVERTGGVPLFVEELTRAVLESGDARLSGREIPATLHDSLMARLDRLGPAKEVIQIAAVIGSEFSYELVHAVHPIAEEDFRSALRNLTDADLLYVRGIAPDARYQFKHALIRDAAYEALLKSRRKDLHGIVARTIDKRFTELKDAHPELLAHHWAEAGEAEPAISAWQKAGESALDGGALAEAEGHYRNALRLLDRMAESHSRDRSELRLQLALGEVLIVTKGYRSDEKVATFDRARKLAEKLGAVLELVWVLSRTA
jgi:class 3 adenylate cyclase